MATIHTFTGNEVIATEVPKYLNDNFSALNKGVTNLESTVVKTVNGEKPVNNNVNIIGFDSYWGANEPVQIGDVRFPKGRENSGYIFECISAGTTGSTQPEFLENGSIELANFADLGKIGSVRVIFNMAEKEVDEVLALGVVYSRSTYPELWEWAGKRTGLIISEAEWQQKYTESNGKFVPYYSLGDGSTTFRTPLLGAYLKGAENSADVGKYIEAGVPNITGGTTNADIYGVWTTSNSEGGETNIGAFNQGVCNYKGATGTDGGFRSFDMDASRCSPVYGNSDTVTPETMTGVWVIKAVGVVVDSGETDIANMLQGVEEAQRKVSELLDAEVGFIKSYSGNEVPSGYLPCNGGVVSRNTYARLFSIIGTTYGSGDGSTTFNLPNLNNNSFLEGSNTVGTVKSAGLPNITGEGKFLADWINEWTGCFSNSTNYGEGASNKDGGTYLKFDASLSNPIYGNSNTVQPKSVTVKYCIKY